MKSMLTYSSRCFGKVVPFNYGRSYAYNAFADPTYDVTFKMIFGNEANKHLLISLINSLLDFKGRELVQDVQLITNEIPISYEGHIKTAIDVRCKVVDGREILVEIQRQYKDYFLSRSQYYMAKAINLQMQDKQSKLYSSKMMPIYLLSISREALFKPSDHSVFENDLLFEKTVVPTIREYDHIEFPENKMHWKYYELNKFKKTYETGITNRDPIKLQWLDFLSRCSLRQEIPEVDELVKQAYGIMERAKWNKDTIEAFELAAINETFEEDYIERRFKQGLEKGITDGLEKGKKEIAIKMLQEGLSKLSISKYTGLSADQIGELEQKDQPSLQNGSKPRISF